MAKRARGSVRPGQRRPIDRRPAIGRDPRRRDAQPDRPQRGGARARGGARGSSCSPRSRRPRPPASGPQERASTREGSAGDRSIAVRGHEYAYVARDLKDIARIAALLFVVLFALYLIIDVFDVVKIG